MKIRTPFEFGAVVAARRRELGLTQEQLATRSGVTRLWLVKFENGTAGDAGARRMFDVARALDLDVRLEPAQNP